MPTSREIIFVVRDQSFNIKVNGLLPLTYHHFYFEGRKNTNVKPAGGIVGDPLRSDENGQVEFTFYYKSGLATSASSLEQFYQLTNNIAGTKEIVVSTINADTLPDDYATSSTSYSVNTIDINLYQPTDKDFQYGFGER